MDTLGKNIIFLCDNLSYLKKKMLQCAEGMGDPPDVPEPQLTIYILLSVLAEADISSESDPIIFGQCWLNNDIYFCGSSLSVDGKTL